MGASGPPGGLTWTAVRGLPSTVVMTGRTTVPSGAMTGFWACAPTGNGGVHPGAAGAGAANPSSAKLTTSLTVQRYIPHDEGKPVAAAAGRNSLAQLRRRVQAAEPQLGSSSAMRKEEPQPHEATTFGLFTWKPLPISDSV